MVNLTHGMSESRTYNSWRSMWQRCTNKNHGFYPRYGGRGITIDKRWDYFPNFLEDMGTRPDGHELDRIDPDGNYCKANCKWSSGSQNSFNKRSKGLLPMGVSNNYGKFQAKIRIEGKQYCLGTYNNPELAHEEYKKVCLEWYGKLPPEKIK